MAAVEQPANTGVVAEFETSLTPASSLDGPEGPDEDALESSKQHATPNSSVNETLNETLNGSTDITGLEEFSWEAVGRSREASTISRPDQVYLNIGGSIFHTTVATLTFAGGPSSFFVSMFSGRFPVNYDRQGRIFIDRDGTYFRFILSYLRDGGADWKVSDLDLNLKQLKLLHKEARFYNIYQLKNKLATHINFLKHKELQKCHVTIVDGDRYYVSLAVELFLDNGFVVNGYTGTASSNSKWVSVLLRGNRLQFMSNKKAVSKLRGMLVSGFLVTEFFAQIDEKDSTEPRAYGYDMPHINREISSSQISIYSYDNPEPVSPVLGFSPDQREEVSKHMDGLHLEDKAAAAGTGLGATQAQYTAHSAAAAAMTTRRPGAQSTTQPAGPTARGEPAFARAGRSSSLNVSNGSQAGRQVVPNSDSPQRTLGRRSVTDHSSSSDAPRWGDQGPNFRCREALESDWQHHPCRSLPQLVPGYCLNCGIGWFITGHCSFGYSRWCHIHSPTESDCSNHFAPRWKLFFDNDPHDPPLDVFDS
eukprot:g50481.t1